MLLDVNGIKEIIPHRYPFLLVDCIEEMEPGVKAVGYKNVTVNEPFFQGHFPQAAGYAGGFDRGSIGTGRCSSSSQSA